MHCILHLFYACSAGGFGTGDVLGFLIDLPDNADSSKCSKEVLSRSRNT